MDQEVKRRLNRERLTLNHHEMERHQTHHGAKIISPVVTRRPEIDSMLADTAYLAKRFLEEMRNKTAEPDWEMSRRELQDFKDVCEMVLRQAKTEIEIEKHVMSRTTAMSGDEISETIQLALKRSGVPSETTNLVLEALGLFQNTSESASPL